MNAKEHAESLRQEAIKTLLGERNAIDAQLKSFGYDDKSPTAKRRGRPPKVAGQVTSEACQEQQQIEGNAETKSLSPAE